MINRKRAQGFEDSKPPWCDSIFKPSLVQTLKKLHSLFVKPCDRSGAGGLGIKEFEGDSEEMTTIYQTSFDQDTDDRVRNVISDMV